MKKIKTKLEKLFNCELYYHKTDGCAEYLTNKYILCSNGEKEGIFENADLIIRIDGGEIEVYKIPNVTLLHL